MSPRSESPDDWRGGLVLPGRTVVRGRGVQYRVPAGREPDFGLYLGVDYHPAWEHDRLEWPDFGLPRDPLVAVRAIEDLHARARDGEYVETACRAGKGRTGTVVACLAILDGLPASHAVGWTRKHFHHRAVQTPWQRRWVRGFEALRGRHGAEVTARSRFPGRGTG
ncbi:protein-tyrosine phosphatase family protein [Actinomycetospora atypica]|uniref:Protein-tyrosine phosphatase family protein n=1 Tax=Actinomycetospora atypica TaxID=1290095 RepID=A0ABV9YID4_9PSEU